MYICLQDVETEGAKRKAVTTVELQVKRTQMNESEVKVD